MKYVSIKWGESGDIIMLRLRPYKSSDAERIVQWLEEERTFCRWRGEGDEPYPISRADLDAGYRAEEEIYPMTAEDEGKLMGHLTLRYVDQGQREVRLDHVIVDPARRGRGCGRELTQMAARYAMLFLGAEKVSLAVFEEDVRAYNCALAAGFKDVPRTLPVERAVLGEVWHCRRMELDLTGELPQGLAGSLGLARRDMLTGLYNQQGILELLEKWKGSCPERGEKLLLISVDIDRLGDINNVYGHSEGDVAIQTLAEILRNSLSEGEAAARLGGDEFLIAMRITGEAEQAVDSLMHAVIGRLDSYNRISDKGYSLEIIYSHLVLEPTGNLRIQDALDEAFSQKRIVKNNRRPLGAIREGLREQDYDPAEEKLVNEILDQNNFRYEFQPIVDARTGEIYGYEALMRTGEEDSVPPYVILKYAVKCQRLYDVERATFGNVLATVAGKQELFGDKKVFINSIPGYQLDGTDYEKLRRDYAEVFQQMVVEVIEQSELNDRDLDTLLERSQEAGFDIAIDDYGTGYSNTSSLLRYLPNCLKIDRLLITNIQEEPKKQHFVKSIIEFAHDNGFLVLAEGVETAGELRAVIHMGVDLIQGFYTAKPSPEIVQKVAQDVKSEIISTSIDNKGQTGRKIFMVTQERELPLMRLALEQYNGILLADQELTLVGNKSYVAGMSVKIKEGADCHLTLRNVHLESIEGLPCIDIGKNARLTVLLEGDNRLEKIGIRVPEGSSLTLAGSGSLGIKAREIRCYGIGNSCNASVGEIRWASSGRLYIYAEGIDCVALGGGIYRQGDGIQAGGGAVEISVASETGIAIGCFEGAMPISVQNCGLRLEIHVGTGLGIGCLKGDQNIHIAHSNVEIKGSGSLLCGIGSVEKTGGVIRMEAGQLSARLNGQHVGMVGNAGGSLHVLTKNCRLELKGEGSRVWGVGSMDGSAVIRSHGAVYDIHVRAGEYRLIGAEEENLSFEDGERRLRVNED